MSDFAAGVVVGVLLSFGLSTAVALLVGRAAALNDRPRSGLVVQGPTGVTGTAPPGARGMVVLAAVGAAVAIWLLEPPLPAGTPEIDATEWGFVERRRREQEQDARRRQQLRELTQA